jgi:hypothetical protein
LDEGQGTVEAEQIRRRLGTSSSGPSLNIVVRGARLVGFPVFPTGPRASKRNSDAGLALRALRLQQHRTEGSLRALRQVESSAILGVHPAALAMIGRRNAVTNQNPDQDFAIFADDQAAPIVAVDDQIFDLVAPRLVSFSDAQLRRVLDLARGMSRADQNVICSKSRAGCRTIRAIATFSWRSKPRRPPAKARRALASVPVKARFRKRKCVALWLCLRGSAGGGCSSGISHLKIDLKAWRYRNVD